MRSKTSFFNGAVFRKTLLRFWPIWAASLVIWGFLPLVGVSAMRESQFYSYGKVSFAWGVTELNGFLSVTSSAVFGTMAAMAVCSHLYSHRSASAMAVLPVRREGLFLSHYLAGLCMVLGPNVIVFLLTLLVEAAGQYIAWGPLLFLLADLVVCGFFFYSFAVLVGMFTGHILALPAFFLILNFLVKILYGLINEVLLENLLYGFRHNSDSLANRLVDWLTPYLKLFKTRYYGSLDYVGDSVVVNEARILNGGALVAYALAGLAFAALAMVLYRRRRMETAGDVVAVRWARPVFKYGVALCMGLVLGLFTNELLGLGRWVLVCATLLWCAVGCFLAQMLLDKSFKVLKKWRGPLVVTAVAAVLLLGVMFDVTGYQSRVPQVNAVDYVEVTGSISTWPADSAKHWHNVAARAPEDIQLVTDLHRIVAAQGQDASRPGYGNLSLVYHLKNGTTMTRQYRIDLVDFGGQSGVPQPGSLAEASERLANSRALLRQAYGIDEARQMLAQNGEVLYANAYSETWNSGGNAYGPAAARLWNAVLEDFDRGAFVHRVVGDQFTDVVYLRFELSLGDSRTKTVTFAVDPGVSRVWALLQTTVWEEPSEKYPEGADWELWE